MNQICSMPLVQTQILIPCTTVEVVLERIGAMRWDSEYDLPLLLTQQNNGVMICISRIPHLDRSVPEESIFTHSCRMFMQRLNLPRTAHTRERANAPLLRATIGLDAGSNGHHYHTMEPQLARLLARQSLPASLPDWLILSAKPAILCVLLRNQIYLERGVRCAVERTKSTLLKLIRLSCQWEQDQISVEDPLTGTITTVNLREKNLALTTSWLQAPQ